MNTTSGPWPRENDEFTLAGLDRSECSTINCARVTASPAALECKLTQIIELPGDHNTLVLGEVTGIYLADDCMVDGRFDITRFTPVARLGYRDYALTENPFELARPGD